MPKRPFGAMGVAFICGFLSVRYGENRLLSVFFFMPVVLLAGYLFIKNTGLWRGVAVIAVIIAAVAGSFRTQAALLGNDAIRTAIEDYKDKYQTDTVPVTVQGEIYKKDYKNNKYVYTLKSPAIAIDDSVITEPGGTVLAYFAEDTEDIGIVIVSSGTVSEWSSARNDGNFDEASYYEAAGYCAAINVSAVDAVYGKKDIFKEALWHLRMRWRQVYAEAYDTEAGGILSTMVLGDKSLLDADIKRLYQICGISHILAISGLHISVIGATIYRFLRRRGLGFLSAATAAASILGSYGIMIGMGTSVKRATVMFVVMLLADTSGRAYDSYNALGLAALILMWGNPLIATDAGFQFSFAAVIGAVWAGNATRDMNKWIGTLAVTFAIQIVTMPLAVYYYYEIPVYAVIFNMMILPLMGMVLGLGIAGGLIGVVQSAAGRVALIPACFMIRIQLFICDKVSLLPGAVAIIGKPAVWCVAVYYLMVLMIIGAMYRSGNAAEEGVSWRTDMQQSTEMQTPGQRMGLRKNGAFRIIYTGGSLAVMMCLLIYPKVQDFELDVLDVGQGDGSYIHLSSGQSLFVDGGSSSITKVGEYRILPFLKSKGIKKIDYWFISHTDSDHISGLLEILDLGYKVDHIVAGVNYMDADDNDLMTAADEYDIDVIFMKAGDTFGAGDASIDVLSPDSEEYSPDDLNGDSLVFILNDSGFEGIFTGDIGEDTEKRLVASGNLTDVVFYKTAHHGSKYSNTIDFLEELSPEIAVISCGENNYGHPAVSTIEHLEETGADIYITKECGQVKIRTDRKGALHVWQKQ